MSHDAMHPLLPDLEELLAASKDLWPHFRNARVFIAGGTGFLGRWLLESFLLANRREKLNASITALSRDPDAFLRTVPHLRSETALNFTQGDVRSFNPPAGYFSHIIHAAAESSGGQKHRDRLHIADTIVGGTRRLLDFARTADMQGMVYISSGAVYGNNRAEPHPVSEDDRAAPLTTDNAVEYDESKRMAEAQCVIYHREFGLPVSIARGFSFVGPGLPLDEHFAIGNFIRDALAGGPIRVNGSGTAIRSYLYTADLALWIWTILARGAPARPYNVGGNEAVSIADLARLVAKLVRPGAQVEIAGAAAAGDPMNYLVPDIRRASEELSLRPRIVLNEAILRTANWYRGKAG